MIVNILRILAFYLCINYAAQAQQIHSKYQFIYYASIHTHILEEYNGYLYFDNSSSVFYWEKRGDDALQSDANNHFTRAEHLKDGEFNYYNKTDERLISKNVVSKKEFHFVEQKEPDFNWKISEESQIIAGYKCFKATTDYMGREYTAWFTGEIPASFGPWKLNGLPGLILKAYDKKEEIYFSINKIVEKNITRQIKNFDNEDLISLKEYYQREVDYPFEELKRAQSKAPRGGSISISNIDYNFLEKDFEYLGKEEFKNK